MARRTLVRTIRRIHDVRLAHGYLDFDVETDAGRVQVKLDVVADEDDPHAVLSAQDAEGRELASWRVAADFKLSARSAGAWVDAGYARPG